MWLVVFALVGGALLSGCSSDFGSVADYATDEEAIEVLEIADGVFIIAPINKPAPGAHDAACKATTRKLRRWVEESDYVVLSVNPDFGRWPYFCVTVRKPPEMPEIEK